MKYMPEDQETELDAKTKQYIRMGELLRDKTEDLTQLIVLLVFIRLLINNIIQSWTDSHS